MCPGVSNTRQVYLSREECCQFTYHMTYLLTQIKIHTSLSGNVPSPGAPYFVSLLCLMPDYLS